MTDERAMIKVELFERRGEPGVWSTEAIGPDGEIYQAVFIGPEARERATEYAAIKYPWIFDYRLRPTPT